MAVRLSNVGKKQSEQEVLFRLCKRGHLMMPENTVTTNTGTTCRTCVNERAKARYHADPEAARARGRRASEKYRRSKGMQEGNANARKTHCAQGHEYTEENTYWYGPEGKRQRQCNTCRAVRVKESYRRHRERRLAEGRARWAENPERYREYSRQWQQRNRERSNLLSRVKKQRRRNAGTLTVADWKLVLDVYGHACLVCGKDEVTIDHVIPVSKGGLNVISNVQPLCGFHNTSKGTKTIDYRPEPWEDVVARAA